MQGQVHSTMAERKIFVLVDDSPSSNWAFRWYLKELARERDEVIFVHCAEFDYGLFLPGAAADVGRVLEQAKKKNEEIDVMMNGFTEQIRPLTNIKCKCKVLQGKPGEEIIKCAEEEHPQIIIMGSRGLGKLRRTLLGSVSEYVIHHAPTSSSVTIVRCPE